MCTQSRQAPGQDLPAALGIGHRKHAQHHRAQCQCGLAPGVALPSGLVRQRQPRLQGVGIGVAQDATGPFVLFAPTQVAPLHGLKTVAVVVVGVGGFDDTALDARQHVLQSGRFAAPPTRDGGQLQFLPQQVARQGRHKAQQRVRLQKARARRVGHQHIATAHGLQQAGHAQGGVCAQLQRVQPVVVNPLQKPVHRLQALQGFEVQLLVAHRQVVALHQAQAQVARQVSVFEIGFVVRSGREQRNVGRGPGPTAGLDAVDQGAVGVGQPLHRVGFKCGTKQAGDDLPVFEQVTQTRGRLGALRQQPPAAIRPACQVESRQRQIAPTDGRHALHGR